MSASYAHPPPDVDACRARLAQLLEAAGLAIARGDDGRLTETVSQLRFAVAATWPRSAAPGLARSFGVRIDVAHDELFGVEGVFEYSYGSGSSDAEAADAALTNWIEHDLAALRSAAAGQAVEGLKLTFGEDAADARQGWEIYLGPMLYYAGPAGPEPCCEACLFAQNAEVLMTLLDQGRSCAVKIVAGRDADGEISADCRIDGRDWPEGRASIMRAVASWPPADGLALRRQYLIFKAPARLAR
jgi:hypothetical protein